MPLREELATSGSFLFRWRSYLPIVALALVASQTSSRPDLSMWAGLVAATIGLLIRCYVVAHVPRGTSGRNTRSQVCSELNTTGAYSTVRHPLYLGNFFIWLGISLIPGVWWVSAMVALVFWLYYERIMFAEEEFLRRKFGARYLRWARATPAFVPDPRRFTKPRLPASLRTVLRREYSGVFAVVATFSLLELWGHWATLGATLAATQRHPLPDSGFLGVLAVTTLAYLTLRALKKHSRWLEVEGR